GPPLRDGTGDDVVPDLAGGDAHHDPRAVVVGLDGDATGPDPHDGAGAALVRDDEVGPPAEDEQRLARLVPSAHGLDQLLARPCGLRAPGGAADPNRGDVGKRCGHRRTTARVRPRTLVPPDTTVSS